MLLWGLANALAPEHVEFAAVSLPILLAIIPIAIGFAILQYRLYDIDILINRTLVYVPLTAILAGLYVALTGLFRAVFTEMTDLGSDPSIAISTLAVVAVLTPLKNQLQVVVDRHFKEQPDPLAGLRRLSGQARAVAEVLDTDAFVEGVLRELVTGLGTAGATVTSRDGRWVSYGDVDETQALSRPLTYRGQTVGELIVFRYRDGRTIPDADAALAEAATTLALLLGISTPLQRAPVRSA
jgi:hypothetical protein